MGTVFGPGWAPSPREFAVERRTDVRFRMADGVDLTRGWLRVSQRTIDPERSLQWLPHFPHRTRAPLQPEDVVGLAVPLEITAQCLLPSERLVVRLMSGDHDQTPQHSMETIMTGHVRRQSSAAHTVHDNEVHPSSLVVPITRRSILGTSIGGPARSGVLDPGLYAKFEKVKHG